MWYVERGGAGVCVGGYSPLYKGYVGTNGQTGPARPTRSMSVCVCVRVCVCGCVWVGVGVKVRLKVRGKIVWLGVGSG